MQKGEGGRGNKVYFNKNKRWYFGAYHLGFRNSYNFNSEIICFGLRDTFFIKRFAKRWYNKDACVLIYIYFLSCFYVVCSVSVSSSTISRCLILKRRLYSSSAARISNMYRGLGFPVQKKKKLKKCYTVIKINKFVRKILNIDRKRLFTHFVVYFCAIFYNKNIQINKQLVFQ